MFEETSLTPHQQGHVDKQPHTLPPEPNVQYAYRQEQSFNEYSSQSVTGN